MPIRASVPSCVTTGSPVALDVMRPSEGETDLVCRASQVTARWARAPDTSGEKRPRVTDERRLRLRRRPYPAVPSKRGWTAGSVDRTAQPPQPLTEMEDTALS
ncbi:dynein heavy chain [Streptomyces laurentii]|uniref:Dynein heavy chain n=1 Tax=Streptomyces laurentii TaxID=39478 RepID=A0A169PQQ5_STRLU|nr:dynein heavy chain [Streptomyces laurentii]